MREAILDRMEMEFMEKGMEQGERQAMNLIKILMDDNRFEDLKRVTEDDEYRRKLCRELLVSEDK